MASSSSSVPQRLAVNPSNDTIVKNPDGSIFSLVWVKSVKDVVDSVPIYLRGFFQTIIEETFIEATQYVRAKHTAATLKEMSDAGRTPMALNSLKTPVLQLSASFLSSDADKSDFNAIQTEVDSAKRRCLRQMIKAKQAETNHFLSFLSEENFLRGWKTSEALALAHFTKTYPAGPPSDVVKVAKEFGSALPSMYLSTILELANTIFMKSLHSKTKKRKASVQQDVEMADAASSKIDSRTIATMVDSVLSRRKQSQRDKKSFSEALSHLSVLHYPSLTSSLSHRDQEPSQGIYEAAALPQAKRQRKGVKARPQAKEAETALIGRIPTLQSSRESDLAAYSARRLDSFSHSISLATIERMVDMPLTSLAKLRAYHPEVHRGENVHLSRNVSYFLALNIKHCFPISAELSVPMQAFEDLADKARKLWKFRDSHDTVLPGIRLQRTGFVAANGPHFLERGIDRGRSLLASQLEFFEPLSFQVRPEVLLPGLACTVREARSELLLKQYMAFTTDKNLGVAVTTKDWYESVVRTHLLLPVYRQVSVFPFEAIDEEYRRLCAQSFITGPITRFLHEDVSWEAPTFHGIPKIHKNPWAIRPIVPMHSYITNRLAKYIQVLLHPLLRVFPWECSSSKLFVWKLLRYGRRDKTSGRRLYSGDVRSMYTNIPNEDLLLAIQTVLKRHSKFPDNVQTFILSSIEFLNRTVYFRFQNSLYSQVCGIAMGLPCGPALANLYMCHWEETHKVASGFLFYQRYLDDVFAVDFTADHTSLVQAPGLVLDWVCSTEVSFLDVFVHFHGQDICVMPHTKRLNHYQYLPWSSAHPFHVKKGMVTAELRRASYTSAKEQYFVDRSRDLFDLLRLRGYPSSVLSSWFKLVAWRDPLRGPSPLIAQLNPPPTVSTVFVPTIYNPTWSLVDFQAIYEEMLKEWRGNPPPGSTFQWPDRVMKSFRRTTSLWDLVRKTNKEVLSGIH